MRGEQRGAGPSQFITSPSPASLSTWCKGPVERALEKIQSNGLSKKIQLNGLSKMAQLDGLSKRDQLDGLSKMELLKYALKRGTSRMGSVKGTRPV